MQIPGVVSRRKLNFAIHNEEASRWANAPRYSLWPSQFRSILRPCIGGHHLRPLRSIAHDTLEKDQKFESGIPRRRHSARSPFLNRNRQENWRNTRINNRYSDNSRTQREFNRFEGQGVGDNRRFDSRRRSGQSDHRFNNQSGRQGGSRNGAFRCQNGQNRIIREQRENPELGHIYRYLENPDNGSVNTTAPTPHPDPKDIDFYWYSAQAIATALFENYISRYGSPISLISDNGPQFISNVFEHVSHRLNIKHIKTVTYRLQANLTERVNRTLVQMIACFVEESHDNWGRFLPAFSFALRTAVNEITGKIPAELFLGRKIITPFRTLINVTDGAEYVGGNIEKLFDEARQNMRKQHKTWEK
ncbi:retrovirus-related Pol polyprotein from transposon 297 [Trichonephila clavipes]|uniref:Retrovirus-related Pol polyprotein from transposon 297 n=1 Tax=Trichonephila clavipes TaxID=2585209 RepID=A0A8X6RU29_TRICX|nr:retrovirus-related Pol polyprotein from transposon 297 [Trichonephila clavipes]